MKLKRFSTGTWQYSNSNIGTGSMHRRLDQLYQWSGYAAALCLLCIALTVIAQIVGRFVGVAIDSTESAGFFLAGATFLGLAHTFKSGDHIRVTLLTRMAKGRIARLTNLWACGVCGLAMMYFSYWAVDLVYFSWRYNDVSPGLLAIPFWIPRSMMAFGVIVFTISVIDEFIGICKGQTPSYEQSPNQLENELLPANNASETVSIKKLRD